MLWPFTAGHHNKVTHPSGCCKAFFIALICWKWQDISVANTISITNARNSLQGCQKAESKKTCKTLVLLVHMLIACDILTANHMCHKLLADILIPREVSSFFLNIKLSVSKLVRRVTPAKINARASLFSCLLNKCRFHKIKYNIILFFLKKNLLYIFICYKN